MRLQNNNIQEGTIIRQIEINNQLAEVLKSHGINKFYITSLGNSLATGYSMCHSCKPLLFRNGTLKEIFEDMGIKPIIHQFTREENNNDEHIHEWYHTNRKEKAFFKFNRLDAILRKFNGLTEEDIDKYYPEKPKRNDGLKEIIMTSGDDIANVVIYSGATGSFLDNVTRGGIPKKLLSGFKRDYIALEATLKDIENKNRHYGSNTQVYLYGIPDYMGFGLSDKFVNKNLKQIASRYSNVKYVEPIRTKFIYKNGVDVHLSEEEYAQYINNVMQDICDNYSSIKSKIAIDRDNMIMTDIIKSTDDDLVQEKLMQYLEDHPYYKEEINTNLTDYLENLKYYLKLNMPSEERKYPNGSKHGELLKAASDKEQLDNFIVYNCSTGEIFNSEKEEKHRIYGTSQGDFVGLENLLMNVQADNRRNDLNTKVYLYGKIELEKDMKKISSKYANVQYIKADHPVARLSEGTVSKVYTSKIISSVIETKDELDAMIGIDRELYLLSEETELLGLESGFTEKAKPGVEEIIDKYITQLSDDKVKTGRFYKRLRTYLLERSPYDFFFVGKKNIKEKIKCLK